MNAARAPSLVVGGLVALASVLGTFASTFGDDSRGVEATDESGPREVEVPLGSREFSRWLAAGWVPVDADRYRGFRDATRAPANEEPPSPRIERAEYTARFEDGELVEGEFQAEIRVAEDARPPWLVDLGDVSLALGGLASAEGSIVGGLTDHGRNVLWVDSRRSRVPGGWTLRGGTTLDTTEFDVSLPTATVSTLRLELPPDRRLVSDAGVVRMEGNRTGGEGNVWVVELGTRTRCRLQVLATLDGDGVGPSLVLVRRRVEFVVQPETVDFRASLDLSPVRSDLREFAVDVPPGTHVERVEFGSETPLDWRETKRDDAVRLHVRLPDPITGPVRPVVLRGRIPLTLDGEWTLPNFDVVAGRGTGPARFLTERGTLHVQVTAPLRAEVVALDGIRRVLPSAAVTDGRAMAFEEVQPNGTARIRLSYPRLGPRLESRAVAVTYVDTRDGEWRLRSALRWEARAGRTYELRAVVPRGWRVTDVAGIDGAAEVVTGWRLRRGLGGVQVVSADLRKSLSSGQSQTVLVDAVLDTNRAGLRIARPVVRPLDSDVVDSVLLVDGPPGRSPELLSDSGFDPVAIDALGDRHRELVDAIGIDDPSRPLAFRTRKNVASAVLDGRADDPPVAVSTVFGLDDAGRPRSFVEVDFGERAGVAVQLGFDPRSVEWRVVDEAGDETSESVVWTGLPAGPGEEGFSLWTCRRVDEDSLRSADEELIVRSRPRPVSVPSSEIALPFVPNDPPFEGRVELDPSAASVLVPRFDVDVETLVEEDGRAAWRYTTDCRLTFERPTSEATRHVVAADVELRTSLDADGVVHEAEFLTVPDRRARRFSFALTDDVELLESLVDGRPRLPVRDGGDVFVETPTDTRSHRITLRYRSGAGGVSWRTRLEPLLPATPTVVRECRWVVALAAGWCPVAEPSGGRCLGPIPRPSLTRRIFGPLGRPAGSPLFNPLVPSSWTEPAGGELADRGDHGLAGGYVEYTILVPSSGSVSFTVASRAVTESLAWLLLFGSLGLGLVLRRRVSAAGRWGLVCVPIGLIIGSALPGDLAVPAGGVLVGLLMAWAVPPRLLESRRPVLDEAASIADGSTLSFRHAPHVVLWLALGGGAALIAEDAPGPIGRQRAPAEQDVVVPVPTNGGRPRIVYVSPAMLARIEAHEKGRDDRERTILREATYETRLSTLSGPPTVVARYRIAFLPDHGDGPRTIELPIRRGNLSGPRPCVADGLDVPVEPGNSPDTVLLTFDDRFANSTEVDVVCTMHPPTSLDGERRLLTIPTPPLLANTLRATIGNDVEDVQVSGGLGAIDRDGGVLRVDLGSVNEFRCSWGPARPAVPATRRVPVAIMALHEVSPMLVRSRCRVRIGTEAGEASPLVWAVPDAVGVRVVGLPAGLASETSATANGTRIVVTSSKKDEGHLVGNSLFVDLELISSPEYDEAGGLRIPSLDFLVPRSIGTTGANFVRADDRVGVVAGPEWRLTTRPGANGAIRNLAAEALREKEADWDVPTPRLAFVVDRTAPLVVDFAPRNPTRSVEQVVRHLVGRRESNWTLVADVVVDEAPVFGHRLLVPDPLVVESVSLVAEDAERTTRWSREEDEILVELNERVVGLQRLRVVGWMPIEIDESFTLPGVVLRDAVIESSEVVVSHAPDVELEFDGEGARSERFVGPIASEAPADWKVLGRFEVEPDSPPLQLVARLTDSPGRLVFTNRLLDEGGTDWTIETRVQLENGGIVPRRGLRIRLPADYEYLETTADASGRQRVQLVDQRRELAVVPGEGTGGDFEFTIRGRVTEPIDRQWALETPRPATSGIETLHRFAVEDGRWIPLDESDEKPSPSDADDVPVEGTSHSWLLRRADTRATVPRIPLVETWLTTTARGVHGKTYAVLRGEFRTLDVAWSPSHVVESVSIDGRAVPLDDLAPDDDGRTSIPLPAHGNPALVRLDWRDDSRTSWPVIRSGIPLPVFESAIVDRALVSVADADNGTFRLGHDMQRLSAVDFELERLDGLLGSETSSERVTTRWADRIRRAVTRADEMLGADSGEERDRLDEARRRLANLRTFEQADGGSTPADDQLPDDEFVHTRIPTDAERVAVGVVPLWLVRWPLVVLGASLVAAVLVFAARWIRFDFRGDDFLAAMVAIVGVVWWTCLRFGGFGLLLLGVSVWLLVRERRRPRRDRSEIVV